MLVAHRAAHLADPDWKVKQQQAMAELRAAGAVGIFSTGGPFTRRLEYEWDGLCGWQH